MNEWMENKTDKMIINTLFNIVLILNLTSYLKGSFVRPKAIPQVFILIYNYYRWVIQTKANIVLHAEIGSQTDLTIVQFVEYASLNKIIIVRG